MMTQLLTDRSGEFSRRAPFISVVMPVRNEEACLGALLRQLLSQDYPPSRFEILVVDGRSTDGTRRVIEDLIPTHDNLRLLDNPRRWSSAARNIGVRSARGEVIVIIDGHCEIAGTGYLRAVADAFERSGADCLGRPQPLEAENPTSLQRAIGLARASSLGHHPASFIYSSREQVVPAHSVAVAYRRAVFDRVGMFDENFDACEDVELNYRIDRAGLRCVLVPELAVSYRPRGTLGALFFQIVRYGRGRMRLARKHRDPSAILGIMPAVPLAGAMFGWVGTLVWTWWTIAYLLMLAIYGLLVAGASLLVVWRAQQWRLVGTLCAVFVVVHSAFTWGVLCENWFRPSLNKQPMDPGV